MQSDIPDKLYFKIGEVSKIVDVAPHVLRYWETEFREVRPKRINSQQRLYRRNDVEILMKIKTLLHGNGYTISGARRYLAGGEESAPTVPGPAQDQPDAVACLGKIKAELLKVQQILAGKK